MKTEKKHSEKLLCVLLIHLTVLQLSLQNYFAKAVLVELAKWYLEAQRGLRCKREYLPLKTVKKFSKKLLCVLLIHLTQLQLFLQEALRKTVLVEFAKWYLEAHRGLRWKRKYIPLKTGKKISEKLFSVLLIHLTVLQLSPQEAFC